MIFDVLTLFPDMFDSPLRESILGRAIKQGVFEVRAHNLRDWAEGKHLTTDDTPYGGGDGMVMKPEPIAKAIAELKQQAPAAKVLLMTPQGVPFQQQHARDLAQESNLIFLCGRYEGFDERVRQTLVDAEFSIGDFVLTGGELPAMVMIDAISRNLPGVLGSSNSAETDSFVDGLLEYPQYTRPAVFNGMALRTLQRRPELLDKVSLSDLDRQTLDLLRREVTSEE